MIILNQRSNTRWGKKKGLKTNNRASTQAQKSLLTIKKILQMNPELITLRTSPFCWCKLMKRVEFFIAVRFVKNLRQKLQPSEWSIYAAPPPSFSMLNVVRRSVMRVKKSTKTDFNTKFRERTQHWKGGGGCVSWFKMFVITKDIEHKNVKRQVLEPLSANVPPKKSQPLWGSS